MVWIFAAVVFVTAVVLAIKFRWMRRALLYGVEFCIGAAVVGASLLWTSDSQAANEREAAKRRISLTDVKFEDLKLTDHQLVGRIRNDSVRYDIDEVQLKVILQDCARPEPSKPNWPKSFKPDAKDVFRSTECETVGQETMTLYTSVPSFQTRGID